MERLSREELDRIREEALAFEYDTPGPEEKRILKKIKSREDHEIEMRKMALRRKANRGNLRGTD